MDLDELKDATIVSSRLTLRELFQFHVIKGNGHWSIWIGPVLVTIDYWGWENRGYRLISVDWRPD